MKKFLICLLVLFSIPTLSQSNPIEYISNRDKAKKHDLKLMLKMSQAQRRLSSNLSNIARATTHHYLASVHYAIDSPYDSIYYHLNKCIAFDSLWFCKYLSYKKRIPKEEPELFAYYGSINYFVFELPEEQKNYYIKKCKDICGECKKSVEKQIEKQKTIYFQDLLVLQKRDQQFRTDTIVDWLSQNKLDSLNRISLDSLFDLYGFPDQNLVSVEGAEIAWYVLQHSTDCTWNQKWFQRFLDAYQKKQYDGGWLEMSFKRFYNLENGFCREKSERDTKDFMRLLKEKYPKEYAKKFGYDNF